MKIFVVDDDNDLLNVIHSLLSKRGFQVEINSNWNDGFNRISKFQPQLILLDVFLSGIDGLDICRQLKSTPQTQDIPVVIFSGYPSIAESVIYEYGADDFIAKPFEVNDLISKLHEVVSLKAGMFS